MSDTHPGLGATPRPSTTPWIALAALVIALIAVSVAGWSLLRPAPAPALFTAPAADNPKEAACKAVALVAAGIELQSRTNLGPEPVALETVAANTRLAIAGGAAYLRDMVPENTPAEIGEPIATLAGQLQDTAQHFFAGQVSSDPEQSSRLAAAEASMKKISALCK